MRTNKQSKKYLHTSRKWITLVIAVFLVVGVVLWQTTKSMQAASMVAAFESSRQSLELAVDQYKANRTDDTWRAVEAARVNYEAAFGKALAAKVISATPEIAASAALQIETLRDLKRNLTTEQRKIGSRLFYVAQRRRGTLPREVASLRTSVKTNSNDVPLVEISATSRSAGLKRIEKMPEIQVVNAVGKHIQAYVPFGSLETLASHPEILSIREATPFFHNSITGEEKTDSAGSRLSAMAQPGFKERINRVKEQLRTSLAKLNAKTSRMNSSVVVNVSEGDKTHRAEDARSNFGVNGAGVKIGVISDGVDSLASLQASGDLPAGVTVLSGQAGSGDEGSAMLEIVHDLAPNAQLYFATALPTQAQFAQNIRDLRTAGCNIIVDDIIYLDESPLHDGQQAGLNSTLGIIGQAVNDVTAAGALYFSSAGNEGNVTNLTSGTWEGDFLASAAADPAPLAGANLHNFGDGGNSILVDFGGGNPPLLHWSDPLDTSSNDYDMYDMDGGLTTVFDASTDTQDGAGGNDDPIEFIGGGTFGGERLLIDKFSGADRYLSLRVFRGELDDALATNGSTHGHSSAADAFSVAATPVGPSFDSITPDGPFPGPFTSANEIEGFSSDGPRHLIFKADGTLFTPGNFLASGAITRQKPDITAADGVSTAAPGFLPFYGTSAAAPHAAAIAALLLSANPALTPAQVRTALLSSAIDIGTAGTDVDSGAGIVMAYEALQFIGATPQAFLAQGTTTVTEVAGDNDGFPEPCERFSYTFQLNNIGGVSATAISAALTSTTPGVIITPASSTYADIAAASSGSNTTPFIVTLPCSLACGTTLNLTLTVTYTGGSSPQVFTQTTILGAPGAPQTFSYTGPPVPIPDSAGANVAGTPATVTLPVAGVGALYELELRIDGTTCNATAGSTTVGIDHTFVNDLQIKLTSPALTTVLAIDRADSNGNNFCQTVLDDDTANPSIQTVVSTNAPFTGTFKPASPLSAFDGQNADGNWTLTAQDFFIGDTGNIRAFSLEITPLVCQTSVCTLVCPANITVTLPPASTTAVVNYAAPTLTGGCGIVTCTPPSGSTFSLGVTTVTCTSETEQSCSFTVSVIDNVPPVITCPANITVASSPNGAATAVTYPDPIATDNLPGVTVACTPTSGSNFAIGTTNVTCTATDVAMNTATCTFTVTVTQFTPVLTETLVNPLGASGPGDVVSGGFSIPNGTAAPQTGSVTINLQAGLVGLMGTCIANYGTCTINATTVTWNGTIPAGVPKGAVTATLLNVTYQAQIANNAPLGATLCAPGTATFGAATATATACITVNLPQAGPGLLPDGQNAVSDQKPGSVLVYPLYSSSAANASSQNTRIAITNTNTVRSAYIHLFFVDGSSCSVADSYICLTPNQTATVLASDIDPGTTGYLVAVAVNSSGCPISFNHLIGDEYVKLASGHQSNLGAESIAAVAGGLTACNPLTDSSAVLAFNNVSYNALPRVLASSNIPSRGDGNDTYVVIDRIGGNLSTSGSTIGGLFGILYDDAEAAYSFSLGASACQSTGSITNDRPRVVPRFETVIPSGRSGWFKVWGASDIGILGAQINRNANAGTNASAFNHGHNLHKLTYTTTSTLTIPVFPPSC